MEKTSIESIKIEEATERLDAINKKVSAIIGALAPHQKGNFMIKDAYVYALEVGAEIDAVINNLLDREESGEEGERMFNGISECCGAGIEWVSADPEVRVCSKCDKPI